MRLIRAIGLRLLYGLVSLLFISLIVFASQSLAPGDAATVLAGPKATPQQVVQLRHEMGLDKPWVVQFGTYVWNAAHLNFGRSYFGQQQPVKDILEENFPMTAKNALAAVFFASAFGILFGTLAGVYQRKVVDKSILTFSILGVTLPNFVLAPILAYFFAVQWDRLPLTWEIPLRGPEWKYLVLPVFLLAIGPAALITRLCRASVIDAMQQEYVKLAVAKGVPKFRLVVRHALRNAILPVISAIGMTFGGLLTGSFVIETFFRLPGIGSKVIEAITRRDVPVIQAGVFVTGFIFIAVNLLVDILLPILDPRIREAQI